MAKKAFSELPWFSECARMMVRFGKNFREAAAELGQALSPDEINNLQKRDAFQKCLRHEEMVYWEELGSNPERTKAAMMGMLFDCAKKLYEEDQFAQAVDALSKLAKIEYGLDQQPVSVIATLTQEELDKLKAKLQKLKELAPVQDPLN